MVTVPTATSDSRQIYNVLASVICYSDYTQRSPIVRQLKKKKLHCVNDHSVK